MTLHSLPAVGSLTLRRSDGSPRCNVAASCVDKGARKSGPQMKARPRRAEYLYTAIGIVVDACTSFPLSPPVSGRGLLPAPPRSGQVYFSQRIVEDRVKNPHGEEAEVRRVSLLFQLLPPSFTQLARGGMCYHVSRRGGVLLPCMSTSRAWGHMKASGLHASNFES